MDDQLSQATAQTLMWHQSSASKRDPNPARDPTGLDIEDPGFDDLSGNGIMMPAEAFDTPIFADGFESGDASAWTN